jgi:hypothetical protein
MTESPDAAEEHGQPDGPDQSYDEESRGEGTRQHLVLDHSLPIS